MNTLKQFIIGGALLGTLGICQHTYTMDDQQAPNNQQGHLGSSDAYDSDEDRKQTIEEFEAEQKELTTREIAQATTDLWQGLNERSLEKVLDAINRKADVNAINDDGGAILMKAVFNCSFHPEIIQLLLDQKANPHAEDHFGRSPFSMASQNGDCNSVEMFLLHGTPDLEESRYLLDYVKETRDETIKEIENGRSLHTLRSQSNNGGPVGEFLPSVLSDMVYNYAFPPAVYLKTPAKKTQEDIDRENEALAAAPDNEQ